MTSPYTFSHMVRTTARFGPGLMEHAGVLARSLAGEDRLPVHVRAALHLRLARVLRCPVCLVAIPPMARVTGLTGAEIDAALEGDLDGLDPQTRRAVAWAAAVARAGGEMPIEWPEEAREMTMRERERVLMLTRLLMVVHAVGLSVVPAPLLGVER